MSEPRAQVEAWVASLGQAFEARDSAAVAALFTETCYWRDLLTFTWNITTSEGRPAIRAMLDERLADTAPGNLTVVDDATEDQGLVTGWFRFETAQARGVGYVRLRDGLAWTLLTSMEELRGHEEKTGRRRAFGAEHGVHQGRSTWLERRLEEEEALGFTRQPYTVIVGGGQGGLALGARLRRLGVPTIIVEKNPRAGDSWRNRYKSLCLHDPVWYDHMPYLPFPDDWPVYSPKDKIGDWLEMYARVMELNVWTSSEVTGARFDEDTGRWEVVVDRGGQSVTLHPVQLVLATGMSGIPNVIDVPGASHFRGTLHHSSQHRGGEGYRGKNCVVIGSNNSAHDICADLWEHGAASVTMVQRSSTHISTSDSLFKFGTSRLYSEDALERGITTWKADLLNASVPYAVMHEFHKPTMDAIRKQDADLYERLEKAGFLLDYGDDESGLHMKYIRRGSGYYIDVGASELVADGSELPADLVISATGYGSMNGWAAKLINQEVADKVGKCWGIGSDTTKDPGPWEGELRNMWKPTQQPGLWFQGGNLHQSRHYSQYLALQLKARMEGLPTPVYALAPSYHRA
jgi:putative flavoprotein involved in K+ transport